MVLCLVALASRGWAADKWAEDGEHDHDSQGNGTQEIKRIDHLRTLALPDHADAVALSGNGKMIAAVHGRSISILHAIDGAVLHRIQLAGEIRDVSLSAEGDIIAVATGAPTIDIYSTRSAERLQQLHRNDGPDFLRKDPQNKITLYPDGKKLASVGKSKRIYVSDVATGNWDHIMFIKSALAAPRVSPDGNYVALFGEPDSRELSGQVTMYKVRRGLQSLWTRWHDGDAAATIATFSPKANRLATKGEDGIIVWEVADGRQLAKFEHPEASPYLDALFVQDKHHLLIASPNRLQLWSVEEKPKLKIAVAPENAPILGVAGSNDGTTLATLGKNNSIDIWAVIIR